jgi:GNAT superfamily N-acetyltransferase
MIRIATDDQLDGIAQLGPKFWSESNLPGGFKPDVFVENWKKIIARDQGCIIFNQDEKGGINGAIGLLVYQDINDGELVMQEAFWFVSPESRGFGLRLLKKAEEIAKMINVKRFVMTHLLNGYADQLSRLYPRMGFKALEINYIKHL